MNKYAILSLILIFIVLIVLKVNFFWLVILAIAAAYFVRRHLQSIKPEQSNEELINKANELEKTTAKEEKAE